ncbi:MAG: glycosidase, partial [Actinobacteria bacterium]|nr:glycosidase [Actinomycetota bacterium]
MTPEVGNELEAEGVLNPGSGRTPDGELYLLPRLVAAGNVSRVGLARVVLDDGVPVGVEREGVVLAPDAGWERGAGSAGTEDPRVTWIEALGLHVMSYVAYGPMGPRPALAVSENLRDWRRLGPLHFVYQPELDLDLNLFPNKDVVFFPEPVAGPGGVPSYAMLDRPTWDLYSRCIHCGLCL